jgi:hypothetical protein
LIAAGNRDAAAARQPYFAAARVAAAGGAQTPAARVELLLEALAIAPDGDAQQIQRVRLGIFEAEFAMGNDALAASAMELPQAGVLLNQATAATMPDRARLAGELATVYERVGREGEAAQLLAEARDWSATAAERAGFEARRVKIEQALAVEAANAGRRPVIGKGLEQGNVVRPRVASVDLVAGLTRVRP